MAIFSVRYTYGDDPTSAAARDEHRAAHRSFLADLAAEGSLLGSGPLPEAAPPAALLIFTADSAAAIHDLLREDPFQEQGLVVNAAVEEWNLLIGPWAQA